MDKPYLHIIFLLVTSFTFGQNLVPNGSFEEYYWCPDYANGFYIDACKYWSMPTLGTSDYFNECSTYYDSGLQRYLFSVPQNYVGDQEARTGKAYAGFLFTQGNNDPDITGWDATYSEYIQVELSQTLIANKFYELTFYVSNPATTICGNSVGALFSSTAISASNDKMLLMQPQIQSDLNVFFCDSIKWFEIKQIYLATGNEKFLTIGVFTQLYEMLISDYDGNVISSPNGYGANEYLYIDDVSLTETNVELPNVFTPNGDGINDICTFDLVKSSAEEIRIFNRWGETVFSSNTDYHWDGKLPNGDECTEGVYFYSIKLKNDTVFQGFISLMR